MLQLIKDLNPIEKCMLMFIAVLFMFAGYSIQPTSTTPKEHMTTYRVVVRKLDCDGTIDRFYSFEEKVPGLLGIGHTWRDTLMVCGSLDKGEEDFHSYVKIRLKERLTSKTEYNVFLTKKDDIVVEQVIPE